MESSGPIKLGTSLVLVVLLVFTNLVSTEDKCRSGCRGGSAPQTFKYAEGTTYKYNLDGNIEISVSSAEGQQSTTKIRATVLITQLSQCNQLLKLQNVQIVGPDTKKYGHIADIEKPVRLNFHDGHLEDVICAEPGDTQNSLNVKRAVASLFQANLKHNHETDVFGVCPTEISSRKEGGNLVIEKSRVLNKCAHRETIKQDFLATTFNLNSEIKSSPLLKGDYHSEQRIKNGILDHAVVTENYLYVPFSVGKNGAKAVVSTKIQFAGTSKDEPKSKVSDPKSIIFENPHLVNTDKSNVNSILAALKEAKKTIDVAVSENSAREFVNLIKILRVSSKDDILTVYGQVKAGAGFSDKVGTKRIFLDALLRAGTGEALEVGIALLKNKELDIIEQRLVYLGLSFVKHATLPSLNAAADLLDQPNLPRQAYLGVGTLARRYCRQHPCKNVEQLNKLIQKLASKLGDGKAGNRKQEEEIVSVLKAIGNIHSLNDAILGKLTGIAQDKKQPARVRVAALETYLADACKDKLRDSALGILKDIQEDSEIRIKAYLVVAKCPNGKAANALKVLLEKEPSYQVGGFIVSHLRNLRASANPDKELAKQQLSQVTTTKRFPIDIRRYSFNSELSSAFDTLGLASAAESDVIYSQKSFLPRSANLNLTVEVFGHTVNLLELSARQENLDKVLEHYFGPLGVFSQHTPEELFASGKASVAKIIEHARQRYDKARAKRDVSKSEIEGIGKQVHIKTNELNTDLDIDLSLKLFGSELAWHNINGDNAKLSPISIIDKFFDNVDQGIDKVKSFEKSIQSNLLFLDSEFAYPTSLGYPLKLSVEGSAATQLKTSGQIDLKALLKKSVEDSTIVLSLIPSANIEVTGSLTLDAHLIESGLKTRSSLYTATGGDLKINIFDKPKDNSGIDIKFSLPVEKQKLISASHEVVFNSRELGHPEVDTQVKFGQNKDFSICMEQLTDFIGLTFCADINSPSANAKLPFPLSGNGKFSVGIERDDVSEFHYRLVEYYGGSKVGTEVTLETIGKNNNKKLSLQLDAFYLPQAFVKATLVSPIKTAVLEGRVTNSDQEKSLTVKLSHDKQEYLAKLGVSVTGTPAKYVYKPLIEYKTPTSGVAQLPIKVDGTVTVENVNSEVSVTFDNVKVTAPNSKFINVQGKLQLLKDQRKLNAEVTNNFNPQANFNVKLESSNPSPKNFNTNLQLIHGADLSSKRNKLTLAYGLRYDYKSPTSFDVGLSYKFSYPIVNLDTKLEVDAKPQAIKYDFDVQSGDLALGSKLDLKYNQKAEGDYAVAFDLHGLDNKLDLKAVCEVNGEKSKIDHSLEVNGKKLEVSGTLKHHRKPQDYDLAADLVIKASGLTDPVKINAGLLTNPNELDTNLKVVAGSATYVDFFLKATKDRNANSVLKISLKDILLVNGQLKLAKGVGNGDIVVELPKLKRKLKADSTFTLASPTYKVDLALYPDFEKDSSNKLVLSTNSELHPNSISSQNSVEVLGKKLEVNLKGNADTAFLNNGKLNGELEITLPSERYYLLKLNREVKTVDGIHSGNIQLVHDIRDNKNTPGTTVTLKGVLKNLDTNKGFIDIAYNIALDGGSGKNLNVDLKLVRQPKGDEILVEGDVKASGTAITNPVDITGNLLYKHYVATGQLSGKLGDKAAVNVNGKYSLEEGSPISGEIAVDAKTPSTKLQNLKLNLVGSAQKPENPTDYLIVKGSGAFVVNEGVADQAVDVKGSGEVKLRPQDGQISTSLNYQKEDPISVSAGYGLTETETSKKLNANVEVQYQKDKAIKSALAVAKQNTKEYTVDFSLDTPQVKDVKLQINTKTSDEGKGLNSEVIVSSKGEKFVLTNQLKLSEKTPVLAVQLTFPNGRVDKILAKLNIVSHKHFSGDLQLAFHEKEFALDSSIEVNAENPDDITIKVSGNSVALKLDNVVVEAKNKAEKKGKGIQISATVAGKNYLSGSTSYKAREEGGKYIIEGSGDFKVKEESKTGNFKYVHHPLTAEKNGETGVEVSFNAGLGSKAIDAEFTLTNKHFRILNSYCEETKQCAHVEVDSKITTADAAEFNHELELAVDLRKLGLSHEFGLKGVTNRKNFVLDHTVDVYFQNKKNKYQYSLYARPNEAGASLTTPKRTISVEGSVQIPKGKGNTGPIKGELLIYLNKKNQPNEKTAFIGSLDCHGGKPTDTGNCDAELRFSNPALGGKDLAITYNGKYDYPKLTSDFTLVLDIFTNPQDKIVLTSTGNVKRPGENAVTINAAVNLKSEGLKVDITWEEMYVLSIPERKLQYSETIDWKVADSKHASGILVELTLHELKVIAKLFNKELVNVDSKLQLSKESQVADTTVSLLGVKPVASHLEIKNFNTLKYVATRKEDPSRKLLVSSALVWGEIADFRVEAEKEGAKIDLVHASVKLDETNFLKSEYGFSGENVNRLLDHIKANGIDFANALKTEFTEVSKIVNADIDSSIKIAKVNIPNLKPLGEYYQRELQKLREELISDQTLKDIATFFHGIFGATAQALNEVLARVSDLGEKISATIQKQFSNVVELVNKELLPKLKQVAENLFSTVGGVVNKFVDVIFTYLAKVSELIDAHQAELKEIATALSSVGQDIGRFVVKILQQARGIVTKEWDEFYREVKALPITEELKAKYQELVGQGGGVAEPLLQSLKEATQTLEDSIRNPDLKHLIAVTREYVGKRLKGEDVDDVAAIKNIIKSLLSTIDKLLFSVQVPKDVPLFDGIPSSLDFVYNLPRLVAVKLSPLSYLLSGDLPSPSDFLKNLSFNPLDWLPPYNLHAVVVQGQHIFTFNGRHLTFPGKCNYLLTRDAVNGNFSVIGTYTNGILTAITYADKNDIVTVKKGGVVVNNAPSELPVRKSLVDVFSLYNTIHINSKAGLEIICGKELVVCGIHISGFYHGQLRGLLGTADSEPYDDFTLPNGKIVASEADFGNAYKVGGACPAVKTVDHHVHSSSPACNKLFGSDSSLRLCYNIVDPGNYKMACEHGLAAGVKDTEKAVAIGYVASCRAKFVPVRVPAQFVQCNNGEKPVDLGDKFSVKLPAKAADIVVVVDQAKGNEAVFKELVQPLLSQITTDLNGKGISDVDIHLVGFGGEYQKYPSHYTVGGKLTFKGKTPNLQFSEPPKDKPIVTGCPKTDSFLQWLRGWEHDINLAIGNNLQAKAYEEVFNYPFRANAVKSIIAVVEKPCEVGRLIGIQKLRALLFKTNVIALSLITPIDNLSVKDSSKTTKNVIGFSNDNVYTFADAKKKPEGSPDLRKDIQYNDFCVDFTLKNRGNVFVSNNFNQAKGASKKQFIQVAAHNIANELTSVEQGLDCECRYSGAYAGENICKAAYTKS